jgi:hypothetical protein
MTDLVEILPTQNGTTRRTHLKLRVMLRVRVRVNWGLGWIRVRFKVGVRLGSGDS